MSETAGAVNTAQRHIHFVGTYPAEIGDDRDAMEDMLSIAGPYLRSLPCGETKQQGWITSEDLPALADHPDLRVLGPDEDPDPNDYLGNKWKMAVRKGHTFRSSEIRLNYHQHAQENWPIFAELREEHGLPGLAFQVNLPGTLQNPMFAFRRKSTLNSIVNGLLLYRGPFEEASQREVDAIQADPSIGDPGENKKDGLLYQLEIPAEVGGLATMPEAIRPVTNPLLASVLAGGIIKQVAGLPPGAPVVIHACNGDWEHRAYSGAGSKPIAALAASIMHQWPEGPGSQVLDGFHFPFGAGDQPPSTKAADYSFLGRLATQLPDHTRFIAGIVHEKRTFRQQMDTRNRIEDLLQRQVDVAASCGFGRGNLATARMLTRQAVELVTA